MVRAALFRRRARDRRPQSGRRQVSRRVLELALGAPGAAARADRAVQAAGVQPGRAGVRGHRSGLSSTMSTAPEPAPGEVRRLTIAEAEAWIAMRRRLFPVDPPEAAREEIRAIRAKATEAAF